MVFTKDSIFMRIGLISFILTIIGLQMSFGQNSFHRNYPAANQKNILPISSLQMNSGDYASLEMQIDINNANEVYSDTIIITCFKPKGDIKWSKSIHVSMGYTGYVPALGSIVQGINDSLYFSLLSRGTDKPNVLIGSISLEGDLGFLKSYGSNLNNGNSVLVSNLLEEYNESLFNCSNFIEDNEQNISLSRKSLVGNTIWAKSLAAQDAFTGLDLDETLVNFNINKDTTLVLTGIVDSNNISPFLLVTDTLGNPIWSKKYTDIQSLLSVPFSYSAVQLPDSGFVFGGFLIEFIPPLQIAQRGFIIKTDKTGEVEWSKKVIFNDTDDTGIKKLIVDQNGSIIASGINVDANNQEGFNFVVKFDKNGNILWKKKYTQAQGVFNFAGNLFNTRDRGFALNAPVIADNLIVPSLLKLDANGSTTCEENIDEEIFFDNSFISDTLIWTAKEETLIASDVAKKDLTFTYDIPVLELSVRPFCPNEPIDWTFSATTEGATNYKWSTGLEGPEADTLRVFEEGEYMVTVTIGEDVCYMLCDTVSLERYTEPEVLINLSLGNFCANGKQTLSIGYQPGHPQIKSIQWSTGETAGSIEISNPGTYSVTIVDQCDEMATANINVGAFPTKITSATITDQIAVNCLNGTITGILSAQGNSTGLGLERYNWSTGVNTKEISINNSDVLTYTVTVTDGCGNTATATKVLELNGAGLKSVKISKVVDGICKDKSISLNAVTDVNGSFEYVWSNGIELPKITTTEAGAFTITVTDKCGNSATDSSIITSEEFEPADIKYANIFFPEGAILITSAAPDTSELEMGTARYNRTFGPIPLEVYCLDEITNYEFFIYNRWGQKVFESNRVSEEWNGTHNDEKSPTETYVWVVKYTIFGVEKVQKGSVTLLRP